ncbi:LacI family DNA-binding transcriptional regulator [Gryllotalpicola ginsengisoli]|uniref:LacI family DNA-binding transcriptional regulator n=1 Tax=Gryllotalpicola ginsengisoli TaxID=444608 RepID=UPI00248057C7|nr:LacI family DNA-binding transcriptional regulator [Gryllotalpicola ginsengisoli]
MARRSGFSVMTASRVMSGRGPVSAAAREAVLTAAAELGYVPNGVARGLRSSRTGVVALIISDIENPFYASMAKAAEQALAQRQLRLTISSSGEDTERELELLRAVHAMRADALLITPTTGNGPVLTQLAEGGMPIVQLDRVVPDLELRRVLLDNAGAARQAVTHLADHGHRRIALVSGPQSITTGAERVAGARRAAAERGLELEVFEAASYLHEGSRDAVAAALEWAPTGLVSGNGIVLEACLDVLVERSVRVPDALSLVGFDDLPWMRWTAAPITTVRQSVSSMTAAAVEMLFADPGDGGIERRFAGELVVRASVADHRE